MDAVRTGTLIREARIQKGFTQQALADAINVSPTAVSKWENGHSLPDISLLEPLSDTLGVSISEIVTGERSIEMLRIDGASGDNSRSITGGEESPHAREAASGSGPADSESAIRSVISESLRQRRKSVVKWVVIALVIAAAVAVFFIMMTMIGFKAESDEVLVMTEIQRQSDGSPEWVIHFETKDGRPIYAYTEAGSAVSDDGLTSVNARVIKLRIPPLGFTQPDNYTWGYSIETGLAPTDTYDFYVFVDYADGQVKYSMREEGLFEAE